MAVLERLTRKQGAEGTTTERTLTSIKLIKEPSYVKVYLADLLQVTGLSTSHSDLLFALLKEMNYRNLIHVSGSVRKEIAAELGIAAVTLTKGLESMIAQGILCRQERGVYLVNPYLFGKGAWKDIREIRMTVHYTRGKKTVETEVVREEELAEE